MKITISLSVIAVVSLASALFGVFAFAQENYTLAASR